MKINSFILMLALAVVPFCTAGDCSDKAILEGTGYTLKTKVSDLTYAYNEAASCVTLQPVDGTACCYIKIKFKNEDVDEKFTQKGCITITDDEYKKYVADVDDEDNFKDFTKLVRDKIEQNNGGEDKIDVKSISIDCSSKFLQLAGIALLFFFL